MRFSRLYPVYWAAVLITFCVMALFGFPEQEISVFDALVNLTMVQSAMNVPNVDSVYWTLWVEVQFYVLMGLVYWIGLPKFLMHVLIGLVFLNSLDIALDFFNNIPGWWRVVAFTPIRHLQYFLVGIILYEAWSGECAGSFFLL